MFTWCPPPTRKLTLASKTGHKKHERTFLSFSTLSVSVSVPNSVCIPKEKKQEIYATHESFPLFQGLMNTTSTLGKQRKRTGSVAGFLRHVSLVRSLNTLSALSPLCQSWLEIRLRVMFVVFSIQQWGSLEVSTGSHGTASFLLVSIHGRTVQSFTSLLGFLKDTILSRKLTWSCILHCTRFQATCATPHLCK